VQTFFSSGATHVSLSRDKRANQLLVVNIPAFKSFRFLRASTESCRTTSSTTASRIWRIDPTLTDDHNVLTLLTAGKVIKPSAIQRDAFLKQGKYGDFPPNLYLLPGALEVEDLDFELAREQKITKEQFFAQCRRVMALFRDFDYVFVDCPPNKMLLTQGMLRACAHYGAARSAQRCVFGAFNANHN
jgi:hypothetical protein